MGLSTTWRVPRRPRALHFPSPKAALSTDNHRGPQQLVTVYSSSSSSSCFHSTSVKYTMVRSTIIVRASDALPLAATVDDEQVRRVLLCLRITAVLTTALRISRRSNHYKNTSSRQNSYFAGSHPTLSLGVQSRADNTPYSACLAVIPQLACSSDTPRLTAI